MRENNLRAQKVSKLQQLNAEGVSGYGYRFERTHYADQIAEYFGALETGEECAQQVRLCGRIMRQRNTWMFVELEDETGTIQLFCHKANLNADMLKQLRLLDRGDLIGVYGQPMRTAHGELSIKVTRWELMAKSIQPLPDNADVLKDPEARYRNRHLDLMLNKDAREIFRKRSSTISCMRQYLDQRGFLEFETPILEVQAGGAEARPFTTHHNALDIDMHLRIAPELHLRRLLVGGFEKVYEIGRNFRNEGLSTRHNPEFTSIELYQAYCDYYQLMDLTEDMLRHIVSTVCGKSRITYQGVEIDFGSPFARISMTEAIERVCGVDVDAIKDVEQMKKVAKQLGVKLTDEDSCGEIINTIFEKRVEKTLIQPTFIIDYPVEVSVCQQLHRVRDGYVERFELFVFGRELGNACSELNDPFEQKRRFDAQSRKRDKGHEEIPAPDLEFLHVMEYGMPPMMGLGIGIDRLVMFITDSPSIRDVIAFPTMKPIQESKQVPLVVGATPCVALPPAS